MVFITETGHLLSSCVAQDHKVRIRSWVVNPSLSDLRAPVPSSSFSAGPSWHFWSRTSLRRAGPAHHSAQRQPPQLCPLSASGRQESLGPPTNAARAPWGPIPSCALLSTRLLAASFLPATGRGPRALWTLVSKGTGVVRAAGTRGQQGFSKQELQGDAQPHLVTAGRAQKDWEFADTLLPQPEVAGGGWQSPK